jgi:hypothetical protein
MDAAAWIALAGAFATIVVGFAGYLIAWGVLKGTVAALAVRIAAVEGEMRSLEVLKLTVARLETRLEAMVEQLRDLNAALRWMRQPPDPRFAKPE